MIVTPTEQLVFEVLIQEGAAPGNSLHGWRCEYPERYGACDCVEQTAREIVQALRGAGAARTQQALQWIGTQCESFTRGRCWDDGNARTPDAEYTADRWCDGCLAAWGLGEGPDQ